MADADVLSCHGMVAVLCTAAETVWKPAYMPTVKDSPCVGLHMCVKGVLPFVLKAIQQHRMTNLPYAGCDSGAHAVSVRQQVTNC